MTWTISILFIFDYVTRKGLELRKKKKKEERSCNRNGKLFGCRELSSIEIIILNWYFIARFEGWIVIVDKIHPSKFVRIVKRILLHKYGFFAWDIAWLIEVSNEMFLLYDYILSWNAHLYLDDCYDRKLNICRIYSKAGEEIIEKFLFFP